MNLSPKAENIYFKYFRDLTIFIHAQFNSMHAVNST